jgi:hypothetical protein
MSNEKRTNEEAAPTTPLSKRTRRQMPFPTPPQSSSDNQIIQSIFNMQNLLDHSNWVGKVEGYAWKTKTSTALELLAPQGKPLTILLFGKVSDARLGRYGDYNTFYHDSIITPGIRNLVWKLSPPAGFPDEFFKQYEKLQSLEQALDDMLEKSQRAAKNASEIELKRKIARKKDSPVGIIPEDSEHDFWKKHLNLI